MQERPTFRLAFVAGPLAFVAAVCNADAKQPTPIEPPRYKDNIAGQPTPQDSPLQNPEPVINQTNGNTIITENGKTYEFRPQVTIKELLQKASHLSVGVPQAAMVQTFIDLAKQKADINPQDPLISEDINKAANLLFSYSEICQDPQAGIGGVARGFTQDSASYLRENDPEFWEDHKSPFLNGPCDWSKNIDKTTPNEESKPSQDQFIVTKSRHEGSILITEPHYRYELYDNATLDTLRNYEVLKIVLKNNLDQTIIDLINTDLDKAILMEANNPNDPQIIDIVTSAAKRIIDSRLQNCQTNGLLEGIVRGYASYIYFKDPKKWPENKKPLLDSNCFWGERITIANQYEKINLENGLYLYEGINFKELLSENNVASLREFEPYPNSQALINSTLLKIRDAQTLASQSPTSPHITFLIDQATSNMQNICPYSLHIERYTRLIASLVYEKYPQHFQEFKDSYLVPCGFLTSD